MEPGSQSQLFLRGNHLDDDVLDAQLFNSGRPRSPVQHHVSVIYPGHHRRVLQNPIAVQPAGQPGDTLGIDMLVENNEICGYDTKWQDRLNFYLFEEIQELFGNRDGRRILCVFSAGGNMGCGDHPIMLRQSAINSRFSKKHIQCRAGDLAIIQGVQQGRFIDHSAAGGVNEVGCALHPPQFYRPKHPPSFISYGDMQGNEVRSLQQLVQIDSFDTGLQIQFWRRPALVDQDLHSKCLGADGHLAANSTEPDNA